MKPYRTGMQITESVLEATKERGMEGITITPLISASNLQHTRISKILERLIGSGLINKIEQKGKNTFVITEKGILYLEEYKKFNGITETFGLEL